MQETEKTTKVSKPKKQIDWKGIAIDSGSLVLQGALMALGTICVHKSAEAITRRASPKHFDNVVDLKRVVNS